MPEQMSAGRTQAISEMAESVVISWIGREQNPPVILREAVAKFRILTALYNHQESKGRDTAPVAARMDRLYDSLVESAAAYLNTHPVAVAYMERSAQKRTVDPDKQLRRIERHLPLQERWDRAIAEWRAARA